MKTNQKIMIGSLGAFTLIIMNLYIVDLSIMVQKFTPLVALGYLLKAIILLFIGGLWAWLHKSEEEPFKLFQLGLVAPAIIMVAVNGQNYRTVSVSETQLPTYLTFIASAYANSSSIKPALKANNLLAIKAQVPLPFAIEPSQRSGDVPEVEKRAKPLKPIPPIDQILPPQNPPKITIEEEKVAQFLRGLFGTPLRASIKEIRVVGNTVFTGEQLAVVISPFIGRELGTVDLASLRKSLSAMYDEEGYVNSVVVIPDQTLKDGVLIVQVVEGEISDIEVVGNKCVPIDYIKDLIAPGIDRPLNINSLQTQIKALLLDENIKRVDAKLVPLGQGEASLSLEIEDICPFKLLEEY